MPFDSKDFIEAPVRNAEEIAILDRMAELLATPDRWCQGSLETDGAYCAVGALGMAAGGNLWALRRLADIDDEHEKGISAPLRRVWNALKHDPEVVGRLMPWNDRDGRTHADVLALIARTRRTLE